MKTLFFPALVLTAILGILLFADGWLRYSVQTASILLFLFIYGLFIQSLRPGQTPLITRYAILMQAELTPRDRHYTRGVTWAWVILLSLILLAKLWSGLFDGRWILLGHDLTDYIEVGFFLGSTALFVGELYLRRWVFPEKAPETLLQFIGKTSQVSLKDIWQFKPTK
jgi:uncharacterized membrane protein